MPADPRIAQLNAAIDAGQIAFGAWASGQHGKSLLGNLVPAFAASRDHGDVPPGLMPPWLAHLLMVVDSRASTPVTWNALVRRAVACVGVFSGLGRGPLVAIMSSVVSDAAAVAGVSNAARLTQVAALLAAEGGAPPPKASDYAALAGRAGGGAGLAVAARVCDTMSAAVPSVVGARAAGVINAAISLTGNPDAVIGRIVTALEAAAAGG